MQPIDFDEVQKASKIRCHKAEIEQLEAEISSHYAELKELGE